MKRDYTHRPALERFISMATVTDGCWLWEGTKNKKGYGRFRNDKQRMGFAHRWIYEYLNGAIPKPLVLDHLCRVTSCVNPDHLEIVTNRENCRRYTRLITHCPKGHEYTEKNTRTQYRKDGRVCRDCKKCRHISERARLKRKRAKALLP